MHALVERRPIVTPIPVTYHSEVSFEYVENDLEPNYLPEPPEVDDLTTEDDTPVDIFTSKQQRLLVESLYNSWTPLPGSQTFLADSNVGIFNKEHQQALVPDVFLSVDVQVSSDDWWQKRNRSYFIWKFGKPPEIVVEIVSNLQGGEDTHKLDAYSRLLHIPYYVIFDSQEFLGKGKLRLYELRGLSYVERTDTWLPEVGIGITLWTGEYEHQRDLWLRWCDRDGNLILTGKELASRERQAKEQALLQSEQERQAKEQALLQLEQERQRAERESQEKAQLLAQLEQALTQLRQLGADK